MHKNSLHNLYALKGQGLQLARGIVLGDGVGQYTRLKFGDKDKQSSSSTQRKYAKLTTFPYVAHHFTIFFTLPLPFSPRKVWAGTDLLLLLQRET